MSKALHQLIESLTSTEKAYIKKFAYKSDKPKDNIYYQLFDAIDKQKVYDKAKLDKKFSRKMKPQQLHNARNYLYNLILDTLQDYHSKKSIDAQLHKQLEHIRILFHKSLYSQATKILEQAKKTANKYEKFTYLMQLGYWEARIIRTESNTQNILEYLERGFEEEYKNIDRWKNYRQYHAIIDRFLVLNMKYSSGRANEDIIPEFEKYADLLSDESQALSAYAKSERLFALIYKALFTKDIDARYEAAQQQIELLQQHPNLVKEEPGRYIAVAQALAQAAVGRKNYDKAAQILLDLEKNTSPNSFKEEVYYYGILMKEWASYFSRSRNTEGHEDRISHLRNTFKKYKDHLHTAFLYCIIVDFAHMHTWQGNYEMALEWIQEADQNFHSTKVYYLELVLMLNLLHLIVQYELDASFYINYYGESTYRFIKNRDQQIFQTEAATILFLKRVVKQNTIEGKYAQFKKFAKKLEEIQEDRFEANVILRFGLGYWVENKIQQLQTQINEQNA